MNQFSQFTNMFSLSKTLRFELKPVFDANQDAFMSLIEKDKEIDRLYREEMKSMMDDMHEVFINEALGGAELSVKLIDELELLLSERRKIKVAKKENKGVSYSKEEVDNNKKVDKVKGRLREEIVKAFNQRAKYWREEKYPHHKLKKDDVGILFEKEILKVLKDMNPSKVGIISNFDNFFTYFTGFNQSKENYYVVEDKDTAIGNRSIDENLMRFLENRSKFYEALKKINSLSKYEAYFQNKEYCKYLNEEGINAFNLIVGEINKEINLTTQQDKNLFVRVPKLKFLFKQIGCRDKECFILEIGEGEEWVYLNRLKDLQFGIVDKIKKGYEDFFRNIEAFDLESIYLNKASINTISSRWFLNWHRLAELLQAKKLIKAGELEKIPEKICLLDIKECLVGETNYEDIFRAGKITEQFSNGEYSQFFNEENAWEVFLRIWEMEITRNILAIEEKSKSLEVMSQESINCITKEERISFIKDFCDAFLSIERMIKYHKVKESEEKDGDFYEWVDYYLVNTGLNSYYNAFRNYLTKKPFKQDKIRLNLNSGNLADGFDLNKESDNLCVILRRSGVYYLAVISKNSNKVFDKVKNVELYEKDDQGWEKLEYKLLPGASKSIPKQSTQLNEVVKHFSSSNDDYVLEGGRYINPLRISREVFDLNNVAYDKEDIKKISLKKEDGVKKFQKSYLTLSNDLGAYRGALEKWIDFCKEYLKCYDSCAYFDYSHLKESSDYESIDMFYRDIDRASYSTKFVDINKDVLYEMCEKGQIYLFQIYNKDFAEKKKGKDNLETMILKNLFSSTLIKLNGGAGLFYREKSIDVEYDKERNKDKGFGIIKNKRYSEDKFFFHFSVTINFGTSSAKIEDFNKAINESLCQGDYHILGIDRGEKHLIYYSLIDSNGMIKKQGSFNIVGGKDYNQLLAERAEEMRQKRESWEEIGKIKDLKEGYLSQVIHEIYQLVVDNDAIIVLEDLNTQFKAKRTAKVEKSVYKKFELALAKKLSHLILKDKEPEEVGGVLHPYQLTPPVDAGMVDRFEKKKQWGVMFYVRPDYTSTTDPLTGWRKTRYISNSANHEEIVRNFDYRNKDYIKIFFDKDKDCFRFDCDGWSLFSFKEIERYYWSNKEKNASGNYGVSKKYLLDECFSDLFSDIDKTLDINGQILSAWEKKDQRWKTLVFYWNLLNQIRNTDRAKEGDENDFIQSPVWSEEIKGFFDSRCCYNKLLPNNGDANGAYNIARKGLLVLERVKENPVKPDLFIRNEDWDDFIR